MVVIAGPNGAGKSTFARKALADLYPVPFLNADEIARSLTSGDVSEVAVRAGRETLKAIDHHIETDRSFVLETTLSGRGHLTRIRKVADAGWTFHLHYVWLRSPDLAVARVGDRVAHGGHFVPEQDIRRRYERGLRQLPDFVTCADYWYVYDNSTSRTELVASGTSAWRSVLQHQFFRQIAEGREEEWPNER